MAVFIFATEFSEKALKNSVYSVASDLNYPLPNNNLLPDHHPTKIDGS